MTNKPNPQDLAVDEYLTAQGVTFTAALVGETDRDGWTCDEWRIKLIKRAQSGGKAGEMAVPYFTGTGHRASARPMPADIARLGPRILDRVDWEKANLRPVAPVAAGVLYSLLLDANSADENFHDWCSNVGYDTDSRKALSTYEACCSTRADVHKLFTREERNTLAAILEDY